MKKIFFIALFALGLNAVMAQERDPAYVETISKRVDGNMKDLGITDPAVYEKVKAVIVNHYYTINDLDNAKDSLQKAGVTTENATNYVEAKLYRHHFSFITELMMNLNDEQVEGVKNALTYNVLNVTYTAQLDMIPTLTNEEKRRIYVWLVEARELAMDQGSSSKKHDVFGKYKGKINNYLSARGYNLTKEREGWNERNRQRQQGN